jgi:HEAT repeat protein
MGALAYCPTCFRLVPATERICLACGTDSGALSSREFTAKLRAALRHPRGEVRLRACEILGQRGECAAVHDLLALARRETDTFVAAAAVTAVGQLAPEIAVTALEPFLAPETPGRVRSAALRAIESLRR